MWSLILRANGQSPDIPYFEMPVSPELKELVGHLRPVHRCNFDIFRSILQTGTLQSRFLRSSIAEDPYPVLENLVAADSRIYDLMLALTMEKPVEPLVAWVVAYAKRALAMLKSKDLLNSQPTQSLETWTAVVNKSEQDALAFYGWNDPMVEWLDLMEAVAADLMSEKSCREPQLFAVLC